MSIHLPFTVILAVNLQFAFFDTRNNHAEQLAIVVFLTQ